MNSPTLTIPGVGTFVESGDDIEVKATALRLGVLEGMTQRLKTSDSQRAGCVIARDGDDLVLLMLFQGYEKSEDNGWASVRAHPVNAQTALALVGLGRSLFDGEEGADQPEVAWLRSPLN